VVALQTGSGGVNTAARGYHHWNGEGGVKWWLIEAGGELARVKAATQTVKLILEPVLLDNTGNQVELLIDTADEAEVSVARGGGDEQLLDTSD
jgi:hypothetical protein